LYKWTQLLEELNKPKLKMKLRNHLAKITRSDRSQSSRYQIENHGIPGWQPYQIEPARHSLGSGYHIENFGLPQPNETEIQEQPPYSLSSGYGFPEFQEVEPVLNFGFPEFQKVDPNEIQEQPPYSLSSGYGFPEF
jgi:hypothetical protein